MEGGTYTVTISGFPLDAAFASTTTSATIDSDGETAIVEFRGQYIRTATLVGRVAAEGDPLGGVTVHLSGMSESLTSIQLMPSGSSRSPPFGLAATPSPSPSLAPCSFPGLANP